jgi:PIN domain nuclease of toxin-antitoxin system
VTVLLDAYAVIAMLRGERAAAEVAELIREGGAEIHPLNLAEVIDRMTRLAAADADEVETDVLVVGIAVSHLDADVLIDAGRLRASHYDRNSCAVSLADCVAATHAVRASLPLATSDPHLADVVTATGGTVIALPDTSGNRWAPPPPA